MISAAGCLFYSLDTKRFLFLLRNNTKTKDTWGMPGGKLHKNETVIDGLLRELKEELGNLPEVLKQIPLETFTSMDGQFIYHSFIFVIQNEFMPTLNKESGGYAWAEIQRCPKPLHPGLWNAININVILDKIKLVEEIIN